MNDFEYVSVFWRGLKLIVEFDEGNRIDVCSSVGDSLVTYLSESALEEIYTIAELQQAKDIADLRYEAAISKFESGASA